MPTVPYALNESTITCIINGDVYTVQRDNPLAKQILKGLASDMPSRDLICLFDKAAAVFCYTEGKITVKDGEVLYGGAPVHNTVAERIVEFMSKGLPYEPLIAFLERLLKNPSRKSVEQLYRFMEDKRLPITPDGKILAYKAIRNDWRDKHSGKFINCIGCELSMARNAVDDDPNVGCGRGFHVGGLDYVKGFANNYGEWHGDKIVIVEVDPADVVSVPQDSEWQKMRTCRYKVVAEFTGVLPGTLVQDSSRPYETQDTDEEDDDDWDEDDIVYNDALDDVQGAIEDLRR